MSENIAPSGMGHRNKLTYDLGCTRVLLPSSQHYWDYPAFAFWFVDYKFCTAVKLEAAGGEPTKITVRMQYSEKTVSNNPTKSKY